MDKKKLGRVVVLHGIKTPRKNGRIHRLARAFKREGFEVIIPYYGYIPAILAGMFGWFDRKLADSISAFIEEDDVLVGYSNGATIVYMISQRVKLKGAVLINAALKPDLSPRAEFVHVYHNEGDWVTGLAGLVPFHLWGDMGKVGYIGSRRNVTTYDGLDPPEGLPKVEGHTDLLSPRKLRPWSKFLAMRVAEEVQALDEVHSDV